MTRTIALALALAATAATPAGADTLRDALVSTYNSNPTITGQRAALRGTDAAVALARAAGRPQVSGSAGLNQDITATGGGTGRNLSAQVNVSYPLFTAGRVSNSIEAARIRVRAGQQTLRAVEGDVFSEAVGAYMDVIRDRSIVELNQNNVRVLTTNLRATRDQFQIGDLTRTDVAQSEARLALGQAQLATAQGRLTSSEENYRRVIGRAPDTLARPPLLPPLPTTPDEAARIALGNNPDVIAAGANAQAAGRDVNVARASRLPTLSAVANGTAVNYLGTANEQFGVPDSVPVANTQTSTGIGLTASIPIYQGGGPAARIRQAQAAQGQAIEQATATQRQVLANARSAFATYQAAQNAIAANQTQVSANELALRGARAERTVGTRTVLDVLNAEQELLNAQVQLVSAQRDAYVAGFQLLNAMGQAQADVLGLDGGPLYDPLGNYRHVNSGWNDWSNDPGPRPVATSTATPAELPTGYSGPTLGGATRSMQGSTTIPAQGTTVPTQPPATIPTQGVTAVPR